MLCCSDRTGNPAREPFLAEITDQLGQLAFREGSNQVCGARNFAAHSHIEGSVKTKRKTALGCIELCRGDTQIESDAGDWPDGNRGE